MARFSRLLLLLKRAVQYRICKTRVSGSASRSLRQEDSGEEEATLGNSPEPQGERRSLPGKQNRALGGSETRPQAFLAPVKCR